MNAHPILLQKKYTWIVALFAKKNHLTLPNAFDLFYRSQLLVLIRKGVSDLHCMSDEYLVEELEDEVKNKSIN